jgi:hypothetical protein
MKNIDFLPARYHERYAARAAVIKRWTIVLSISIVITPLAIYQLMVHRGVVNSFVHVEPEYLRAQAKAKRLEELRSELQRAKGEAALLAWLGHRWPCSQVVAHLHAPLPESVRLTSIKLANEPKASPMNAPGRPRAARRAEVQEPSIEASRPVAEKDLHVLHEQVTQNEQVVTLTGVTVNTKELHSYVARLGMSGLFDKSELRSLGSVPGQDNGSQNFEIRVVLEAGHCVEPKAEAAKSQVAHVPDSTVNLARRP